MHDLAVLLRACRAQGPTFSDWRTLMDAAVDSASRWLSVALRHEGEPSLGRGFSVDVAGPVSNSSLGIGLRGVIGCDVLNNFEPRVSLFLFPYILSMRVSPQNGPTDLVYCDFDLESGSWNEPSWIRDEHDEFRYFDLPSGDSRPRHEST